MTKIYANTQIRMLDHAFGAWEWLIGRLLQSALSSFIHAGNLRVVTSGGDVFTVGDGNGKPLSIRFGSASAQLGVLLDPDLRFGEAYMDSSLVIEE